MKIAVSSYSFDKLMKREQITQIEVIQKAKDLGYEAIEFADLLSGPDLSQTEYAKLLKNECDKAGIEVSNFASSANLLYGSDGNIEKEIEKVCLNIDCAEILGAQVMRHDVSWGIKRGDNEFRSFTSALSRLTYACKKITEYGKQKGIMTMVENHGRFFQDVERIEALFEAVDDRNFGLLADIGNFLGTDQDPSYALGKLEPYIFYVHAKDFYLRNGNLPDPGKGYHKTRSGNYLKPTIIGHGDVPVLQCLSVLKANGYDGYISVEFEGMEDPLVALDIGLTNLKKYLGQL